MKRLLMTVAFLAAAQVAVGAEEPHAWGAFKVGSWVKWETTNIIRRTGAEDMEMVSETKQTLVERTAEKAVIEIVQDAGGSAQKNRFDLPFKAEPIDPKGPQPPKPSKTGAEPITIKGKTFPCTWTEYITGEGDSQSTTRTWTSEAMPGAVVKTVSKSRMGKGMTAEMTTVVVDYLAK